MAVKQSKVIGFVGATDKMAQNRSRQSIYQMSAVDGAMNATLVADPTAGTEQIAPEDAHQRILKILQLVVAQNLHKILSVELHGIGERDYQDILALMDKLKTAVDGTSSFLADAKERITQSQGQLGDVLSTNAVHMDSGNSFELLSANEIRILKSAFWRAGTSLRWEAPVILDNAHTRIFLAHSLIQEADLLMQRAQNILVSVKSEFGLSAQDIALLAQDKVHVAADNIEAIAKTSVKVHTDGTVEVVTDGDALLMAQNGTVTIVGQIVDINPTIPPEITRKTVTEDTNRPGIRHKGKAHLELPQWKGMSPIPAYVTTEDEVRLQEKGE